MEISIESKRTLTSALLHHQEGPYTLHNLRSSSARLEEHSSACNDVFRFQSLPQLMHMMNWLLFYEMPRRITLEVLFIFFDLFMLTFPVGNIKVMAERRDPTRLSNVRMSRVRSRVFRMPTLKYSFDEARDWYVSPFGV